MSFNFSQYISKLLNLIDPNLIFSENISKGLLYNLQTTFLEATLTYAPTSCPHCKNNHPKTLIKHGFKKTTTRLLSLNGEPAALKLKKQRFLCKQCSSTFTASTPVVDKFCSISNSLKAHILHSLSKKINEKVIAFLYGIQKTEKILENHSKG